MSAFVVDKAHISAILRAVLPLRETDGPVWQHGGNTYQASRLSANCIGQLLLSECVKSVQHRYPQGKPNELPGRVDAEWLEPFVFERIGRVPTPVEAIKLIDCLEYQSCEHPGWETSQARVCCEALRRYLLGRLPGYEDAAWSWRG